MDAGTIDIQSGCSAVALAVGATEAEAIDRRENERITDNRSDPAVNWAAWKVAHGLTRIAVAVSAGRQKR